MADDDDVTAQERSVREADPTCNVSGNDGGLVGVVVEGGDIDAAGHGGGRGRRPSFLFLLTMAARTWHEGICRNIMEIPLEHGLSPLYHPNLDGTRDSI